MRYLIHVAAFNLGLIVRALLGFGAPKGWADAAADRLQRCASVLGSAWKRIRTVRARCGVFWVPEAADRRPARGGGVRSPEKGLSERTAKRIFANHEMSAAISSPPTLWSALIRPWTNIANNRPRSSRTLPPPMTYELSVSSTSRGFMMKCCDACGKRSVLCIKRFDVVPEAYGVHAAVLCPKCNHAWETSRNPVRDQMRRTVIDKMHDTQRR